MVNVQRDLVAKINSRLKDSVSKEIFMNRLLFSMTDDYTYIKNVVLTTDAGKGVYERIKQCNTAIGIFGAGRIGRKILRMYEDIKIDCFIDNNRSGEYEGLPVYSLEGFLKKYPDGVIVISMRAGHEEVEKQVKCAGVPDDRIVNYGFENVHMSDGRLYFDLNRLWEIKYEREVFVDGGSYNGDNTERFLHIVRDNLNREGFGYVFEPEASFIKNIKERLSGFTGNYEIIEKGLWDKADCLAFCEDDVSSKIDRDGKELVEVDSIDNTIKEPVSFIKMDIEGSEYRALCGAKETIRKYKPRLAISIYHRMEDILVLPELIMGLGEYDFYLRHYTLTDGDTVLFAIPV